MVPQSDWPIIHNHWPSLVPSSELRKQKLIGTVYLFWWRFGDWPPFTRPSIGSSIIDMRITLLHLLWSNSVHTGLQFRHWGGEIGGVSSCSFVVHEVSLLFQRLGDSSCSPRVSTRKSIGKSNRMTGGQRYDAHSGFLLESGFSSRFGDKKNPVHFCWHKRISYSLKSIDG